MGYERLSPRDSAFLHAESEVQPQHMGIFATFDAGPLRDDDGEIRLADLRALVAERLTRNPRFLRKLMTVPGQLGRPVLVDDDDFDIEYHVRLTALPRPGSEDQLRALVARIQSHLLDRRRPLWELWVVDGLDGDRIGVIQKTHHALIDGTTNVDLATVLYDRDPGRGSAPSARPDGAAWSPDPSPGSLRLLANSLAYRFSRAEEVGRTVRAATRIPRKAASKCADIGESVRSVGVHGEPEPLRVPITPHRRWEFVRVDLGRVKAIKDRAGVTVNDVVLAACTAALREFMMSRGVPVGRLDLRASIPLSIRDGDHDDGAGGAGGTKIAMAVGQLPLWSADPAERLEVIAESMGELDERDEAVDAGSMVDAPEFYSPTMLNMATRLLAHARPRNTTIVNVPGPQAPLYLMGAEMLEAFPFVPIVNDMALGIGVLSYRGQMGFGLTGDHDALPDLALIARGIERAIDDLEAAIAARV